MSQVTISTGSRLHFGLTCVAGSANARYGGIGVMVEHPKTTLRVSAASGFQSRGSERLHAFARTWLQHLQVDDTGISIQCLKSPASHSGLGSGTQLAQSVALGINRYLGLPDPDSIQVAGVLDRGQRSFIGSLGFSHGGMIVDRCCSIRSKPEISSADNALAAHVVLPATWRVVMVRHLHSQRTFGAREAAAFRQLKPDPQVAQRLEQLIGVEILPAARSGDFERFSAAVHEYGMLSGNYYSTIQGGPYNGPDVTGIADSLRDLGVRGVGQSSWGPVVFAWCPDGDLSGFVIREMQKRWGDQIELSASGVCNRVADLAVL